MWEEDIRDCEQRAAPVPGQSFCVFPDQGACVFCDGVCGRRRPHDAHSRRCVFRATGHVSDTKVVLFQMVVIKPLSALHLLFLMVAGFMQPVSSWGCSFYMSTGLYTGMWKNWWCSVFKAWYTSKLVWRHFKQNQVKTKFVSVVWNSFPKRSRKVHSSC